MCILASTMHEVKKTQEWTGFRKFVVGFSCCFITVGVFVFGLTLTQSIMNITDGGLKADKSKYSC